MNKNLTYIIYSHSSYDDVLNVCNDYCTDIKEKKILFVDKINDNKQYNFDEIIIYDDNLNYTKRIEQCLKKINITTKYILFNPENNIPISKKDEIIYKLVDTMEKYNIDKLDFCCYNYINSHENIDFGDYILVKNTDMNKSTCPYYNVGTSLFNFNKWKILMESYDTSLKSIEGNMEVQNFCNNYWKCYYINYKDTNFSLKCGYYLLTDIYVYFHLTHDAKLFPKKSKRLDDFMKEKYHNILKNYKFKRSFNTKR
tara:strand:+ start:6920 stop:7684 length:765 start_codon:yes stop_codon:yes gene_type:complete